MVPCWLSNQRFVVDCLLSAGSSLVYHRLPWKEPDAPYMLEVLYEDDHMVKYA